MSSYQAKSVSNPSVEAADFKTEVLVKSGETKRSHSKKTTTLEVSMKLAITYRVFPKMWTTTQIKLKTRVATMAARKTSTMRAKTYSTAVYRS